MFFISWAQKIFFRFSCVKKNAFFIFLVFRYNKKTKIYGHQQQVSEIELHPLGQPSLSSSAAFVPKFLLPLCC